MLFVTLILFSLIAVYFYGTRTFNYWTKRKVKGPKPLPFIGTYFKSFAQKASMGMLATEMYRSFPEEKVVGVFRGTKPELVIRDPEIVKRVLVTDFYSFHARGFNPHKTVIEPLMRNLFSADGDLWRLIRQRFTPAFSSGKLKAMFPLIARRAEKLQTITGELVQKDHYDARELMARYTTDFIGECGFGINMDTLNNEKSQFRAFGIRLFQRSFRDAVISTLKYMFPELCKNLSFFVPEIEKTLQNILDTVVKERNYKPSGRNDFIDLMLELKEKGDIEGESIEKKDKNGKPEIVKLELDRQLMTAQMFVFFGAGFETSSTASSFTLHQLAFNPDCQEKAQAEIDAVLQKYDNKITFDAIKEMHYLEMAFYEAMRMYPSVGYLMRMSTNKEYTFPEINLTIDEDVNIIIPIQALQRDEKYFREPNKFDPERFSFGTKEDRRNFVYLPFGEGPRACVGEKLGQMQSLAGLAAVLHKYTVEPASCSVKVPKPDPTGIISEGFVGGLPLKFRKRNTE